MTRMRWKDWIVRALENLGGEASYADLYAELRRIRPPPFSTSWDATVRNVIESHSSDSDNFRAGRDDLFRSVGGLGRGRWGLRAATSEPPQRAGGSADAHEALAETDPSSMTPLDALDIRVAPGSLMTPRNERAAAEGGGGGERRSREAKAIGDRGEQIVLEYLRRTLSKRAAGTLRWVAQEGETPGWDIEYRRGRRVIAVEVKATTGPSFSAFELTTNEWRAARDKGSDYRLGLVARAASPSPRVFFIDDPASRVEAGEFDATVASWRIELGRPCEATSDGG